MPNYSYIKYAIKKSRLTLGEVAEQTGMTRRYLSQLINDKINDPELAKLEALHHFLKLQPPLPNKRIGVIFGKFYPLHTGHIYLIQYAICQVDELHVMMCYDDERDHRLFKQSAMSRQPTSMDRLRWLLQTFKYQNNIVIHALDEQGLPSYPNGWQAWSTRVKQRFNELHIAPTLVFSSESQDVEPYQTYLNLPTHLVDPERANITISATKIRQAPLTYWEYIPTEVRPFFVRTIAILGGESSGKSTLVNKLANLFNTTSAWEYGRDYIFQQLGGSEIALQYSDYDNIALGHAQYIDFAIKHANKVTFIDTDFVTTQAFCKQYEGIEHPFVQALINEYRFDRVILLENNTPWIADGLRQLGKPTQRKAFQRLLKRLLKKNNIDYITIDSSSYETRFLRCVELVQEVLTEHV